MRARAQPEGRPGGECFGEKRVGPGTHGVPVAFNLCRET